MVSGTLINVADYLGNLAFRVWEKMQEHVQHTPVILDPNTANSYLILSDDLTSLRSTRVSQLLPKNPERLKYTCVLGSEGFNSGTHCWDVETGDNFNWIIGITTSSTGVCGTGIINISHNVRRVPTLPFTVEKKLQKVRVQLDCDRRRVSFYDPVTNKCLHTLTTPPTERVFPFFYSSDVHALKILPVKVFVSQWH